MPIGKPPTLLPQAQQFCITHHEAQVVYDTLEQNRILSPMSFLKNLASPPSHTIDAYKVLDQILEEEGTFNPYAQLLFQAEPTPDPDFQDYTAFYRMDKPNQTTNHAHMEDWSILSTKMFYPQHPNLNKCLHVQDSPDQVNQWALNPNKPTMEHQGYSKTTVMQDYMDCYEEVQNYLHLDENYDDNRDVTTTYLGTEHIYKTNMSRPMGLNSHDNNHYYRSSSIPVQILPPQDADKRI